MSMRAADSEIVEKYSWLEGFEPEDCCNDCFYNHVDVCRHPKRSFDDLDVRVILEYIDEGLEMSEIANALNRDKNHIIKHLKG